MITFFSTPKGFDDPFYNTIQRNAIKSWIALPIEKEIILVGDDPGVKEVCDEFHLQHISGCAVNEYGTPLLNDIFKKADAAGIGDLFCYINADIITLPDFADVFPVLQTIHDRPFLASGFRYLVDVNTDINTTEQMKKLFETAVEDRSPAIDYFIYPRGFYNDMPAFAIGRWFWDSWMPYHSLNQNGYYIDCTDTTRVLHQNHSYKHKKNDGSMAIQAADSHKNSPEGKVNLALTGGLQNLRYLEFDSNRKIKNGKLSIHKMPFLRNTLLKFKISSEKNIFTYISYKWLSVILNRCMMLFYFLCTKKKFFPF